VVRKIKVISRQWGPNGKLHERSGKAAPDPTYRLEQNRKAIKVDGYGWLP